MTSSTARPRPEARLATPSGSNWGSARHPSGDRRPPRPQPVAFDLAVAAIAAGGGVVVAMGLTATSLHQLSAAGGEAILLGNLAGLAGTYLALVMVLLISRIPFVERVLGQSGLLRLHRRVAPWPISLIVAHVVLLTIGYAEAAKSGILHELGTLLTSYPDMAIATIGFAVLVAVAIVSHHAIRRRIRRETWWMLHLGMYLALALSFAHEIVLGPSFVGHPLTQAVWSIAWAGTAGLVLAYRFGLPVLRSTRHRLVVHEVRAEAPGVVSIVLRGRHLERLAVFGGQFFQWRFLRRGLWWQAHPFSISALPQPPYLRLTVKCVGDFTEALAHVPAGTKVAVEGPYGIFTSDHLTARRVALIAGGIGVTAVRSLLEDLPRASQPVVLLRAADASQLVHRSEIAELVRQRNGRLHELVGSRQEHPLEHVVGAISDLKRRETYVAGPEGFVTGVVELLRSLGVPDRAVHAEVYAL